MVDGTMSVRPMGHHVSRATVVGAIAVVLLLAVLPQVIYPLFLIKLMCYALFAASFNLLFGYAGLLSFGQAAFLGTGAYVAANMAKVWGLEPISSLVVGMIAAGILGAAIGSIAIQRKGLEFGAITLALAEMVSFLAHQLSFTGGENGIQGVPRGHLLGVVDLKIPANMYALVLVVFVFGMFAIWRTINSPFGHILRAIRDHEPRAISLGYDVTRYKLIAFVISAAVAGLAGGTKAIAYQFAVLDDIGFQMSGLVVLMTLLGGAGTVYGPLAGAVIVVSLESFLATSPFPVPVITGAVFILCVLMFRRGIVGEVVARMPT
jgi:branched-chain amino acid transport system permease protein